MSRYRFVDSQSAAYGVVAACCVAEVSRSAYYDWKVRELLGPSPAELAEAELVEKIRKIHTDSDATAGSPRVTAELRRNGYCVNHKAIERLMSIHGIVGVPKRRFLVTTLVAEEQPPLPDLIGRDFHVGAPNERTCGDITYIRTDEGWLYLADVLDIGSRRVVGFSMADHMRTELVEDALKMAAFQRGSLAGATFHSDYAEVCNKPKNHECACAA